MPYTTVTMNGASKYQVELAADDQHQVHVIKTRPTGGCYLSVIKPQSANWKRAVRLAKTMIADAIAKEPADRSLPERAAVASAPVSLMDRPAVLSDRHIAELTKFMQQQRQVDEPCKHGHFGCSNVRGGACSDELMSLYPEIEELGL